jgi:hypothetical protein
LKLIIDRQVCRHIRAEVSLLEVALMSSSGIRLRISLIVAISIVSANMYSVLHGTSNRFYAGLSNALDSDAPAATAQVAHTLAPGRPSRDTFAAFETRDHYSPTLMDQ